MRGRAETARETEANGKERNPDMADLTVPETPKPTRGPGPRIAALFRETHERLGCVRCRSANPAMLGRGPCCNEPARMAFRADGTCAALQERATICPVVPEENRA